MGKLYTAEEDKFITENYRTMSLSDVAAKLGRPYSSVQKRAEKLGIKKFSSGEYTDYEKDIIKKYFVEYGSPKCMEFINRSMDGIRKQASKMGLRCDVTTQRINMGVKQNDLPTNVSIGTHGYMVIKIAGKMKLYHRHIMEEYLGRELTANEVVHHVDGDKLHNALSNLTVMTRGEHINHHRVDLELGKI